jgi:hypothetical protein
VTVPTRAAAAVPTAVAATPPAMAWDPAAESTADTVAARGRSTVLLDPRIIQVSPCGILYRLLMGLEPATFRISSLIAKQKL